MTEAEAVVRRICMSFPESEERLSHGHPAWFIRGKKQFASFHENHHDVERPHLWSAAPAGAQEALVAAQPSLYFRPPYVGHRGWLGMFLDVDVETRVLQGVLTEAYLAVCPPALRERFLAEGPTPITP